MFLPFGLSANLKMGFLIMLYGFRMVGFFRLITENIRSGMGVIKKGANLFKIFTRR